MLNRDHDDTPLVARIAAGDERALGLLYDIYGATVYGLAVAITRSQTLAESVVADAFAAVWRDAREFDPAGRSVFAWLSSKVRVLALAEQRANTVSVEPSLMAAPDESPIGSALARLSAVQRTVIELAYFRGMSRTEISNAVGEPEATVGVYLRTAMETLRHILEPQPAAPVSAGALPRMVADL